MSGRPAEGRAEARVGDGGGGRRRGRRRAVAAVAVAVGGGGGGMRAHGRGGRTDEVRQFDPKGWFRAPSEKAYFAFVWLCFMDVHRWRRRTRRKTY